jgi:hypothetical protein
LVATIQEQLRRSAAPTVEALAQAVIADQLGRDDVRGEPFVAETGATLLHKLASMPAYLSIGMLGTAVVFERSSLLRGGRAFSQMDQAARAAKLRRWRRAPIGVLRDFVAFYEKLGVFVYYSHEEDALGHPTIHSGAGGGHG